MRRRLLGTLRRVRALPAWRWLRDHQRLTIIIGLLSLIVSVVALINPAGFSLPPPPWSDPQEKTWPAEVVNTWSDSEQRDKGVFSSRNPYKKGSPVNSYFERNPVEVRCYVPDGRFMTTIARNVTYESRIWYLTTKNEWLPDVFVDLKGKNASPRECYPQERPSPSPSG